MKKIGIAEIKVAEILSSQTGNETLEGLEKEIKEAIRGVSDYFVINNDRKNVSVVPHDENRRNARLRDGKCLLFTTNREKSAPEIIATYFGKDVIEKIFDCFKNWLDMQPVRHFEEGNIDVYIFICYLAYLALALYKHHLGVTGWAGVEDSLAELGRIRKCRVPKLFRQETSPQFMVKLTNKKIEWVVKQVINKGESTELVAAIYGVSRRRIQQLVKYYRETGEYPMLDKKRRPKTHLSDDEKRIIEDAYNESFFGARLLRYHIQKHYKRNIPHNKIHQHLLEVGLARPDRKKQKKRKRCRYERKHSLSLVHADWLDYDGSQVIAYEDDASRKILSIGEFANATTDNAISVFKRAEDIAKEYRGKITAVNTDRGTQFYASGGEKKKEGVSRFKQYLNARGVKHILSKRNNPQTNGKIERWFQEYRRHRWRFDTAYAFAEWYNNRVHGALDLEYFETPNEAFIGKMRSENTLGMFFEWSEKEVSI